MNHDTETQNPQNPEPWDPDLIRAVARRAVRLPEGATREQACAAIAEASGRPIREVKASGGIPWEIAFAYGFDGHRRTAAEIEDLLRPRTAADYVIEDVTIDETGI